MNLRNADASASSETRQTIGCRPMQLKSVFCQIDSDDGNFFHGCLPLLAWLYFGEGWHPPHLFGVSAAGSHYRRSLGHAMIGLPQPEAVPSRQSVDPP